MQAYSESSCWLVLPVTALHTFCFHVFDVRPERAKQFSSVRPVIVLNRADGSFDDLPAVGGLSRLSMMAAIPTSLRSANPRHQPSSLAAVTTPEASSSASRTLPVVPPGAVAWPITKRGLHGTLLLGSGRRSRLFCQPASWGSWRPEATRPQGWR